MSPIAISCVDSFRDAYARTGLNLIQSVFLFAVMIGQQGWRALSARGRGVRVLTERRPRNFLTRTSDFYFGCF
jgi:hypothetical protein